MGKYTKGLVGKEWSFYPGTGDKDDMQRKMSKASQAKAISLLSEYLLGNQVYSVMCLPIIFLALAEKLTVERFGLDYYLRYAHLIQT